MLETLLPIVLLFLVAVWVFINGVRIVNEYDRLVVFRLGRAGPDLISWMNRQSDGAARLQPWRYARSSPRATCKKQ